LKSCNVTKLQKAQFIFHDKLIDPRHHSLAFHFRRTYQLRTKRKVKAMNVVPQLDKINLAIQNDAKGAQLAENTTPEAIAASIRLRRDIQWGIVRGLFQWCSSLP